MKNFILKKYIPLILMVFLAMGRIGVVSAQTTSDDGRYNLAVYATGTQNDQSLPASLQTIIQNRTVTKLTEDGNYRLIERSGEFVRQIQKEQALQQSGEVADEQIAEIGASFGAQKICVVSVTIIDLYCYVATRIVDVSTKVSAESGDAEIANFSIPLLTKTLETALSKMLASGEKFQQKENGSPQLSESRVRTAATNNSLSSINDFKSYKTAIKRDKGAFLSSNGLAYKEYAKYRKYRTIGYPLLSTGIPTLLVGSICLLEYSKGNRWKTSHPHAAGNAESDNAYVLAFYEEVGFSYNSVRTFYLLGASFIPVGFGLAMGGAILLVLGDKHLQKSYHYYINGETQTATLNFHPYVGGNHTFGAGLTLQF